MLTKRYNDNLNFLRKLIISYKEKNKEGRDWISMHSAPKTRAFPTDQVEWDWKRLRFHNKAKTFLQISKNCVRAKSLAPHYKSIALASELSICLNYSYLF